MDSGTANMAKTLQYATSLPCDLHIEQYECVSNMNMETLLPGKTRTLPGESPANG